VSVNLSFPCPHCGEQQIYIGDAISEVLVEFDNPNTDEGTLTYPCRTCGITQSQDLSPGIVFILQLMQQTGNDVIPTRIKGISEDEIDEFGEGLDAPDIWEKLE